MGDIALDQTQEILTDDVSDETLETAGGTGSQIRRDATHFISAPL